MTVPLISWQILADMALVIVLAVPLLAVAGLPIMAIAAQGLARARKRSAYDKCARQLTFLGMGLGWIMSCVGGYILWLRHQDIVLAVQASLAPEAAPLPWAEILDASYLQADLLLWLTLVLTSTMLTLYHTLWQRWRDQEALHQCLGFLAAFWGCFAVYALCCIISVDTAVEMGIPRPASLQKLLSPPYSSSFWNTAPYLPMLVLGISAGMSGAWLVLRRASDDFGRDYYTLMLPWCAVWARNAWLMLWLVLVAVATLQWVPLLRSEDVLHTREFLDSAIFLLMWIIPGLLWTIAVRSKAPLRHKFTLLLAFVLSLGIVVPMYLGLITDVQ